MERYFAAGLFAAVVLATASVPMRRLSVDVQATTQPACCTAINAAASEYQNCGGSRIAGLPFSRRSPVLSQRGQVASAHPLASGAGLDILKAGGSAVDAAIATNAVLSVLEPMMNGPGGDLMTLVWIESDRHLYGYNGAGRSSASWSYSEMAAELSRLGFDYIPETGPLSVTVPGAPRGWCDLSERFGRLPLATVLAPAIAYAEGGAPVPEVISQEWVLVQNSTAVTSGGRFPHAIDGFESTFTVTGGPSRVGPAPGAIFKNAALGATLRAIAEGGCAAFYGPGRISDALVAFANASGLHLTAADLQTHHGEWVESINTTYRGRYTLAELPPNPHGVAALELLNILEGFSLSEMGHNSAEYLHTHVEAKKLAFADAAFYVADPDFTSVPTHGLSNKSYAAQRRLLINPIAAAQRDAPGLPPGAPHLEDRYAGDTTYLIAADADGNMVSWIQSLYTGFGSGLVEPTLGFALQSRGSLFSMDTSHANVYAPGKRPYHTIAPAFAFRDGEPWLSFGVMGGFMQPQGHVQIMCNLVDFGMNVVEAGEAARYEHEGSSQPTGQVMLDGGVVTVEAGVCSAAVDELVRRGHNVTYGANGGGYQAIERVPIPEGGWYYAGASEMRKDGVVMAY